MKFIPGFLLLAVISGFLLITTPLQGQELARTIITTDGEIDDVDSFIRLLLYSNEMRIEGLVYSSSMWHYKGDGKGTPFTSEMEMTRNIYGERTELRWPGTQWIQDLIHEYGKIYPTLSLHATGFPEPASLLDMVYVGNIDFEGEMEKDSQGSEFIKSKLLDDDISPIYLQVWGGTNTLARALKSIEDNYKSSPEWKEIYDRVCRKAILYTILDQDATYRKYISQAWPDIRVYYNSEQFWCLAYPWKKAVAPELHPYLEGEFMGKHIIKGHGPLLEKYYSYGDGQKQVGDEEHIHGDLSKIANGQHGSFGQYDFISEGDSPAFLHLVDVGLNNLHHPEYGGWGGRLIQSQTHPNRWEDGKAVTDFNPYTDSQDPAYPQTRWLAALQQDFAARADWCVKPYKEANHAPVVKNLTDATIRVKAGEDIKIRATAQDPDGDPLRYLWWQYREVGTYPGLVPLMDNKGPELTIKAPDDFKKGETIHLILEVTDEATTHPMTRYKRFILVGG